jgi:hypothetical protein
MSKNEYYGTIDHINLWLLSLTNIKRFLVTSLVFTVFMSGIFLFVFFLMNEIKTRSDLALLASISVGTSLFTGIIFALVFSKLYKSQSDILGKKLQLENLQPVELIELKIWFNKGILPTSKRLKPKLLLYLDYLRPQIEGKQLFSSPIIMNILIIATSLNVVRYVIDIITDNGSSFAITSLIFASLFLAILLSYRGKNGSKIIRALNKSTRNKLAKRESELHNAK